MNRFEEDEELIDFGNGVCEDDSRLDDLSDRAPFSDRDLGVAAAKPFPPEPPKAPQRAAEPPRTESSRPKPPEPDPEAAAAKARDCAANLKQKAGAAYFMCTLQGLLGTDFPPAAYLLYRDQLMQDFGNPSDPLMIMAIEQLVLVHHNIGRLYLKSVNSDAAPASTAYALAAARLLAEHRRNTLALAELRTRTAAEAKRAARAEASEPEDDRTKPPSAPRRATAKKADRLPKLSNKGKILPCKKPLRTHPTRDGSPRAKLTG